MTLAEKHGFAFLKIPHGAQNPIVMAFSEAHFRDAGYPVGTRPASKQWVAVCEPDESYVWCVFGWRFLPDLGVTDFADIFARKGRRGVLATCAALERIKLDADRTGNLVCTSTPMQHVKMRALIERYFGPAQLAVTTYQPSKVAAVEPVREMAEV